MTQTILQLQEAQHQNAQAGGDFLGAIIGWKIAPDIRISHPELEAIARQLQETRFLRYPLILSKVEIRNPVSGPWGGCDRNTFNHLPLPLPAAFPI